MTSGARGPARVAGRPRVGRAFRLRGCAVGRSEYSSWARSAHPTTAVGRREQREGLGAELDGHGAQPLVASSTGGAEISYRPGFSGAGCGVEGDWHLLSQAATRTVRLPLTATRTQSPRGSRKRSVEVPTVLRRHNPALLLHRRTGLPQVEDRRHTRRTTMNL